MVLMELGMPYVKLMSIEIMPITDATIAPYVKGV
jgi:hypothetical protein